MLYFWGSREPADWGGKFGKCWNQLLDSITYDKICNKKKNKNHFHQGSIQMNFEYVYQIVQEIIVKNEKYQENLYFLNREVKEKVSKDRLIKYITVRKSKKKWPHATININKTIFKCRIKGEYFLAFNLFSVERTYKGSVGSIIYSCELFIESLMFARC